MKNLKVSKAIKDLENYRSKSWYYILDDNHKVRRTHKMLEWAKWMEKFGKNRIIKQTLLKNKCWVSTVFLGVDYNWTGKGKPIVFETMVFDKNVVERFRIDDGPVRESIGAELYQTRYTSYEKALRGHKQAIRKFAGRKASRHSKSPIKRIGVGILNGSSSKGRPSKQAPVGKQLKAKTI